MKVAIHDKKGRLRIGTVVIRKIRCGKKNCTKCPHGSYAYVRYREGKKVRNKYLGVMKKEEIEEILKE